TSVPASITQPSSSSNRSPGVRHSTFESLRLGHSSQSIAFGFLRLWDSMNFKKNKEFVRITVLFLDEKVNFVIHGFTPVGRANHYIPSLKAGSIVKLDHFEVARCLSMYKIIDHPFRIRFISLTIIDEVITGAPEINLQSRLDSSVMDSSLLGIALTMVSGKKKILLLKKDHDNPVNYPFQAEQQMEANLSGSSLTPRHNQKIDVGGRLIKGILQRSETA
ncbi:unnamed protein product, partial [Brassica oleracea]